MPEPAATHPDPSPATTRPRPSHNSTVTPKQRRMRWPARAGLAVMVILAALAAGLVPASASSGPMVPDTHFGTVCRSGHSSVNNRSGTICIIRNGNDLTGELSSQALVTFSTPSGTLKKVSDNHLQLVNTDSQTVVESNAFVTKSASGRSAYISTGWYFNALSNDLEAFVYKPCMFWTDGGQMCFVEWMHSCELGACQSNP
jgi:hypothetical protein